MSSCSNTVVTGDKSYITSPNYPDYYGNSEDCFWILTSKVGTYIKLTNIHFDVEGYKGYDCYDYDSVRIHDWRPDVEKNIGNYCNENNPFKGLLSGANGLRILFTSDWKKRYTGFKLGYSLVKPG